jgi:hypothetical protein
MVEVESLSLLQRRQGPAAAGGGGALQGGSCLREAAHACVGSAISALASRMNHQGGRGLRAATAGCQQGGGALLA